LISSISLLTSNGTRRNSIVILSPSEVTIA
jgi:hypothetical protein